MQYGFDADELLEHKIVLDKLDAARRQLEASIATFFNDWDVVAQHTLICAAHGIVYDLAKQQNLSGSFKDSPLIHPEELKEFRDAIALPQNFFKHADRDAGTKLIFCYNGSAFFLFDAVRLFIMLGGRASYPLKVFLMWVQFRYPDILCFKPAEEDLQRIRENTTDPEAFRALARLLIQDAEGAGKPQPRPEAPSSLTSPEGD